MCVFVCAAAVVAAALQQMTVTPSALLHLTLAATLHTQLRLAALQRNRPAESATVQLSVSSSQMSQSNVCVCLFGHCRGLVMGDGARVSMMTVKISL